jgi:hypothetical protein
MDVLIACEFSGIVREAFAKRGHNAWSCDLLPSEIPSPKHMECDVRLLLREDCWDLMIAFPPCTHLAVSGARWWKGKRKEQKEALAFIWTLMLAPIEKIAIENPVGAINTQIRKPSQIIQPYEYGHPESKRTCLWLKGLPTLVPTRVLELPARGRWDNQTPSGQNRLLPSPDRWKDRSRTYVGIAEAMADQWGKVV